MSFSRKCALRQTGVAMPLHGDNRSNREKIRRAILGGQPPPVIIRGRRRRKKRLVGRRDKGR